jgi:hypothetical protein
MGGKMSKINQQQGGKGCLGRRRRLSHIPDKELKILKPTLERRPVV